MREDELRSRSGSRREIAQPRNEALMAKALMAERQQADAWLHSGDPTGSKSSLINRRGPQLDGELKSIVQPLFERESANRAHSSEAQNMRSAEGFPLRQAQPESVMQTRLGQSRPDAEHEER